MSAFLGGLPPWEPQHDQILVRPLTAADRTAGGVIVIPDAARERPQQGIVVAVGPGVAASLTGQHLQLQSKLGDLVAFGKYAGMDFDVDGKLVLIMRDVEALIRRPAGTFTLVEHDDGRYAHVEGYVCEHCPKVVSEVIAAERERLRVARMPAFVDAPPEHEIGKWEGEGGRAGL